MTSLDKKLAQIEKLDARREVEREKMDVLLEKRQKVDQEIKALELLLNGLDNQMETLEEECLPADLLGNKQQQQQQQEQVDRKPSLQQLQQQQTIDLSSTPTPSSLNLSDDVLTDPYTQQQQQSSQWASSPRPGGGGGGPGRVSLETQLTEPSSQLDSPFTSRRQGDGYDHDDDNERENQVPFDYDASSIARPSSRNSSNTTNINNNNATVQRLSSHNSNNGVGQLEFTTVATKKKRASNKAQSSSNGTLDQFFGISLSSRATVVPPSTTTTNNASVAASSSRAASNISSFPSTNNNDPSTSHSSTKQFNRSNFPWSNPIQNLLQKTFRIPHFREHQREVINATLAGADVFVLMRTGGGKSLTYQLPALFEGRGSNPNQSGKVTFVISPLLSLIKDQEDQMNAFAPGSAVSFSSNLTGGQTEHARRWNLVQDPRQGVCLVLVTPEKVSKSNKLKSELQKLYDQNRLGRFVIDEAHCSSNWGHDFRPDYTKLGILRQQFPDIPIMAVTATASDRVRHDVCEILQVPRDCAFFRSSANRPNLTYHVRAKKASWSADAVLDDMAAFIQEKFPKGAGIVYTFSRKDADTVASKLVDRGIKAASYHSDVSVTKKDKIHQAWMRNKTQVVVATIAFGLGINKPDVRFVLHHTLSKTLEAYYQESGRAGRDGKPSQCVLYYSPKDVPRMAKMVHGESDSSEISFWNIARYAQASGGDAVCRAIINTNMGEKGFNVDAATRQEESLGIHESRDVSRHAQTVARILQAKAGQRVTLVMLVKEWRSKTDSALPCVTENPPGNDLTVDECERVIVSLLIEGILRNSIVYTSYGSMVYLELGRRGNQFLASTNPKVSMSFPKRDANATESDGNKKPKARKAAGDTKTTARKKTRKSTATTKGTKRKTASKKTTASKKSKPSATKSKPKAAKKKAAATSSTRRIAPGSAATETIELLSSDDEPMKEAATPRASRPRAARGRSLLTDNEQDGLWTDSDSGEELEFE